MPPAYNVYKGEASGAGSQVSKLLTSQGWKDWEGHETLTRAGLWTMPGSDTSQTSSWVSVAGLWRYRETRCARRASSPSAIGAAAALIMLMLHVQAAAKVQLVRLHTGFKFPGAKSRNGCLGTTQHAPQKLLKPGGTTCSR